jgi:NAD(P)-dependent dehydrogenase (short-subunit alcohol dehydrogenase family)
MSGSGSPAAVVTGGASGIGAAIVERLAGSGLLVFSFDLSPGPAPGREGVTQLAVDVGSEKAVESAFAEVSAAGGTLAALVNCAGIDFSGALTETTLRQWQRIQRVNATGVFLCTRAAARVMKERRRGSIVSVSSANALLGWRNRAAYSASKGAIDAFTRAAAAELGPYGVRVNAVAPGSIETPMWGDGLTPEARAIHGERAALAEIGQPADVADVVAFLVSDDARYVTGAVIPVCGGRTTCDYLPARPTRDERS